MTTLTHPPGALEAYEELAPAYDLFTAHHDHERWLGAIEALARRHGLTGRRVLDVGCGTGKSFLPLLERGYDVTACDLSPAMVRCARRKVAGRGVRVTVADMRALPALGSFDLITCLDDALNYLTEPGDLTAAFTSARRLLAPGGLYVFDVNTMRTYRETFAREVRVESGDAEFRWCGETTAARRGGLHSAAIEVLRGPGGEPERGPRQRHVQRHHPERAIRAALAASDLTCVRTVGQLPGGVLCPDVSEDRHTKLLFLAARQDRLERKEVGDVIVTPIVTP